MKHFTVVCASVAVFALFFAPACFAQLSDLEQKALHEEAEKLSRSTGLVEADLYRNLVLMYMAKQSERAAQNAANTVEAKHQHLRAVVYDVAADASLKVVFSIKAAKELIADLEKERKATDSTIVSPALSRRVNAVGNAATDALLTAAKMSSTMVDLASFEAQQECNSHKSGYAMRCSEALQRSVKEIETAMTILEKAVAPFGSVAILSGTKRFTY